MAVTLDDLELEWDICVTTKDVEAATELGRTLLERNRDLEATIRQQQAQLDDQTYQLQYLAKQNSILRQAAESRLRLCEQLETTVNELERGKARILRDLAAERHKNQKLKADVELAEAKCAELQLSLDQSRTAQFESQKLARSLEQQLVQQSEIKAKDESNASSSWEKHHNAVVLKLADALAEAEEKLHTSMTEALEEKRRREQAERDLWSLGKELEFLRQRVNDEPEELYPMNEEKGLSLGEELLLSTGDSSLDPWCNTNNWEMLQPLSFIDAPTPPPAFPNKDQNGSFDEYPPKILDSCSQSSSGFSEEAQTPTSSGPECGFQCTFCRKLSTTPSVASSEERELSPTTNEETFSTESEGTKFVETEDERQLKKDAENVKDLFLEIFAVIKQNI